MAKNEKVYDDQSIKMLKGADRVRKKPAVIFGSDGIEGCCHTFLEILANAVDEARGGYGKEIRVTYWKNREIEVEDFGRGVPLGWNEKEQRYNWELVFCELYAGGKYDNNSDDSVYEFSLGTNGLGACATQYASEFMEVKSYNGEKLSEISFKKGEPVTDLRVRDIDKGEKKKKGTVIRWKPDLDVFTDIAIPDEYFKATMRRQSVINAGVRFVLFLENENGKLEKSEYYYENGIADYIREITDGNAKTEPYQWKLDTYGRDREDMKDYHLKADITFCISTETNVCEYYHNSSFLEYGGAPDKAVRNGFTSAVDAFLKSQGKYNKNETKIAFPDIADCLVVIVNSSSTVTSYENQTKKAINNVFIQKALTESIKQNLEIYFMERPNDAAVFAKMVLDNKRSRERAEATKLDIRKKLSGPIDAANRVEKFVSCHSKDPTRRELYIVEGDSALTSVKLARDAEFQAVIPVRGKTLNCMKVDYKRIFESPIIVDLLRVIGCGVEIEGKVKGDIATFDLNALRWSKIIICTDADEDGFQIRTLLLTLFYRLLPTLINEGRIYIAESPLFEITTKTDTYFAYNEAEKVEILKQLGDVKYTLQRSKGLGENEPEMMSKTTMKPSTRRLIAITPSDAAETCRIFETLLGNDLPERKRFIAENGARYLAQADI